MSEAITRELHLDVAPEDAWPAVSEPGRLREWLAEEVELELIPGGIARFVVDGQQRTGWVEEVCPPRRGDTGRLTFWWQCGDEPASRVVLELTPTAGGTRLRVSETRPLELLDLVGIPLPGVGGDSLGPALIAA